MTAEDRRGEVLRLGEVLRDGDTVGLRFERLLSHSPERVWRALTASDQLQHWLPVDIVGERREGADIQLPFWPDVVDKYQIADATLPGRIVTWDPPNTFAWQWDRDMLIFALHPTDTGTRLVFTTWVVDTSAGVDQTAAGYHVCLDQLMQLLDTDAPQPFIDRDPTPYVKQYALMLDL